VESSRFPALFIPIHLPLLRIPAKIPVMKYQWLLFDADGTLFDYDLAEEKALEQTFRDLELNFAANCAAEYRKINQQIWDDFENGRISAEALRIERFERLFEALEVSADTEKFSAQYLTNLAKAADLIDGAEETICALHRHFRLAIITNGLQDVQRPRLALTPIAGLFDVVAISEEIGAAKPAVRFFEAVFEKIGQPTREAVLVIGDSLSSDIQGGNNYGLDTCWFNPAGKPRPAALKITYEIRSIPELIPLLIEVNEE
jgi:2-haloacid dehalogenase